MRTLVINDLHLGVRRQGGTTPASRAALADWMFKKFVTLLKIPHDFLLILGDLFDTRNVDEELMFRVYEKLKGKPCAVVLGNHDLEGVMTGMSSAEFVGKLAKADVISVPTRVCHHIYVVPHLFNQTEFDNAIKEVPKNCLILTHCNIDNNHAQGDHSLNLNLEQIKWLKSNGNKVLTAHEHHQRDYTETVTIIGNQYPSSINDCLDRAPKRAAIIENGEVSFVNTWNEAEYEEMHWSEIRQSDAKFIRIVGECTTAEFPSILTSMKELRKASDAFVIGSGVVPIAADKEAMTKEEVTQFNIIELLLSNISDDFVEDIKTCL